MKALEEGIA